ncbi:uncharacterized protein TrAtP1_009598 [Trichoderma atroviride]|uniref:uncharacterized protein n=1 Tax=Hypocrea atroviridis TaxID=63577 RepID=UPI00333342D9|nr:hypothetical protein TrAtP1_009598 [Trichoderma atroviride]
MSRFFSGMLIGNAKTTTPHSASPSLYDLFLHLPAAPHVEIVNPAPTISARFLVIFPSQAVFPHCEIRLRKAGEEFGYRGWFLMDKRKGSGSSNPKSLSALKVLATVHIPL